MKAKALGAVRVACLIVAVAAAALGVGFAIITAIGPSVWVFSDDGSGAGSLLPLPIELRLFHAAAALIACATIAVSAFLLAELVRHARAGIRFVPALSRTTWALALVIGIGSWLAQIARNVATWSWQVTSDAGEPLGIEWVSVPQGLQPNWAILGVAVVVGVLAYIIAAAEALQRDTEGLI